MGSKRNGHSTYLPVANPRPVGEYATTLRDTDDVRFIGMKDASETGSRNSEFTSGVKDSIWGFHTHLQRRVPNALLALGTGEICIDWLTRLESR
jgi:hypothetical protein